MNDSDDSGVEAATRTRSPFRRHFKQLLRNIGDGIGLAFYVLAVVLLAITSWAAIANVIDSGWSSDAAAWVQAAGSIAAIGGAAWLTRSEARRARKVRRAQSEEATWYVRFAIQNAQFESQIIAAELVNRTTPVDKSDVREWRQRAVTCATGLNALASRTDHIHPAVTHVTSNAKVLMDDLIIDIEMPRVLIEEENEPDEDIINRIVSPHRALLELLDLYDARMRGIRQALDKGGDTLPINDWETWRIDDR